MLKISFHEPSNHWLYRAVSLTKRLIFLFYSLKLKKVKLSGFIQDKALPYTVYYLGTGENLNYLKSFYFSELKKQNMTVFPFWLLRKNIKKLRLMDKFVFVEINPIMNFLIPFGGFQTFPWIRQKTFLTDKKYLERKAKINALYGRKVRKNLYSYRITNDKGIFLKFYKELYIPYIKNRYEDTTHLRSIEELQAALKSGFILQVFDANLWVSGTVCKIKNKEITILAFGLLPDYQYHLGRGALSATYYFTFKWAQKNSMETVDLLRSRPHAYDGVYEHKRRWGAKIEKDPWVHSSIWIFTPKKSLPPLILNKQLVLYRDEFIELEKLIERKSSSSFSNNIQKKLPLFFT